MLFELDDVTNVFKPVATMNIVESLGKNEKDLENYLKAIIGDLIFPEYLVFGNERAFQREADLFAVNRNGDLVVFELKTDGHHDKSKIYQAMGYAQHFSFWGYEEMDHHFKKCYPKNSNLLDRFEEHFGCRIDQSEFNRRQKIIIISHSSSEETARVSQYWKQAGVDLEEYFYRIYEVSGKKYVELSNELLFQQNTYNCWINTCLRYFPTSYVEMIQEKKAAAYGERRGIIGHWLNKSHVFLYHNGHGIIAAGKGTAAIKDFHNKALNEDERSILLSDFISGVDGKTGDIRSSIQPYRIKELLQRDFNFPNTIVTLSEPEAKILFEECIKSFK